MIDHGFFPAVTRVNREIGVVTPVCAEARAARVGTNIGFLASPVGRR